MRFGETKSEKSSDQGKQEKKLLPDADKDLSAEEKNLRELVKKELEDLKPGDPIRLPVDDIIDLLAKAPKKTLTFSFLAKQLGLAARQIEYFCRTLAKKEIVKLKYPINMFASPRVTLLEYKKDKTHLLELPDDKNLIESYVVAADYVTADVNIWAVPFENTPIYEIVPHGITDVSDALFDNLIEELAKRIDITTFDESESIAKAEAQRKEFYKVAKNIVKEYIPNIDEAKLSMISGILLHKAFGLGDLEIVMADNWLEEVAINGHEEPLSLYHKHYGWLKTTRFFDKEDEIYNFITQVGRRVGKQINSLNPIMDAHLQTGDRVAATLSPISTAGDTMTIRRFSRNPWTVVHMIDPKNHTMSKDLMAFLWMAIQYELNILVVGGTASGKTSALNTLSALIPPTNRIITIEDTREISLPEALHWNWVPLASKSANAEGKGEVSMLDLMVASLRMRPDRIIVGEIRRKAQAESLFEAMHTGHSVAATMHADTAEQVKRRLTQPPIDIPENELQALQLVTVQYRDRRRGVRRTLEVAELLPGAADERVNLNYLYRWRPRRDEFVRDEPSVRVIEDMNLHTGMTQREIENDVQQKSDILQWMLDNRITDVDKVGQVMRIYYKYPQLLLDTIEDNVASESLLGDNKGGS